MSLAIVYSRAAAGISAPLVSIEVHLSFGLAGIHMVGLPETAVKESKDRVRSALINSHFEFPSRRITVNLAPADLPKEGGRFDLPIALGILAASGQIPVDILKQYEFSGELALSGELRSVRGVLPMALYAHREQRQLIIPHDNAQEASLLPQANVLHAKHLLEVCAYLKGEQQLGHCLNAPIFSCDKKLADLQDVKGQVHAKGALEVAAAGQHSALFIGPPGTGKTMLASRLPSILPEIDDQAALETAAIASVSSNGFELKNWKRIPFRAPHHSSSSVALVGGGRPPKPGEISLAHQGVLFLDELPEFNRHVLECLREPLEAGVITISRAAFQTVFPAQFQLIAAMNPCPCGYAGSKVEHCRCSQEQIKRYMGKISGPLLDRIDMHIEVAKIPPELLMSTENESLESSVVIKKRVTAARQRQLDRQQKTNALLTVTELDQIVKITSSAQRLLQQIMNKFNLSARVYHRIVKVAQTIADLNAEAQISEKEISQALHFRCLDRMRIIV